MNHTSVGFGPENSITGNPCPAQKLLPRRRFELLNQSSTSAFGRLASQPCVRRASIRSKLFATNDSSRKLHAGANPARECIPPWHEHKIRPQNRVNRLCSHARAGVNLFFSAAIERRVDCREKETLRDHQHPLDPFGQGLIIRIGQHDRFHISEFLVTALRTRMKWPQPKAMVSEL